MRIEILGRKISNKMFSVKIRENNIKTCEVGSRRENSKIFITHIQNTQF